MRLDIRGINAAEEDQKKMTLEEIVDEKMDNLEDDFDYAISGLDRLCREGDCQRALEIMEQIAATLDTAIADIGESFEPVEGATSIKATKVSAPIWEKPWRQYAGDISNYSWLVSPEGKRLARIRGWDDDGTIGYDAEIGDSNKTMKFVGTFNTRAQAQKAVAKELKIAACSKE